MVFLMIAILLTGQMTQEGWEEAAAYICGASSVEEMDESEMERFCAFHEKPLDINSATRSRLCGSGLFNTFQVNSICEYRRKSGDILSITELGLLPGFCPEYAEMLRYFVTAGSVRAPGQKEDLTTSQDLTLRAGIRHDSGNRLAAGVKYNMETGQRAELKWASRTTYDDASFGPGTISAAYYGRRYLGKAVAGDFSARFGQGLTQWSGFSLSGYSTIASFRKNGAGLAPTGSFASSLKGLGAELNLGKVTISAAAGCEGRNFVSILNLNRTGKSSTVGITATYGRNGIKTGADWKAGIRNLSIFGEVSNTFDGRAAFNPAVITGMVWTPVYGTKLALLGRYYAPGFKKDYSGMAIGFSNKWLEGIIDCSSRTDIGTSQYKMLAKTSWQFGNAVTVIPSARLNMRYRPEEATPLRTDIRAEISMKYGALSLNAKYNILWHKGRAWLWYAEPGYTNGESINIFARFTLFCVNDWDDRIYCYERDAPGSFNVPAYYGRGYAASAVSAIKLRTEGRKRIKHALHLRTSWISYPWNTKEKDSRLEAKAQYSICF